MEMERDFDLYLKAFFFLFLHSSPIDISFNKHSKLLKRSLLVEFEG